MTRIVFVSSAVVLTGVLVLLAIAIAQRDARVSDASVSEATPTYANQPAQPITLDEIPQSDTSSASSDQPGGNSKSTASNPWPAPPTYRGNDSTLPKSPSSFPSTARTGSTPASLVSYPAADEPSEDDRSSRSRPSLAEPPQMPSTAAFPTASGSDLMKSPSLTSTSTSGSSALPSSEGSVFAPAPATLPSMSNGTSSSNLPSPSASPFASLPTSPSASLPAASPALPMAVTTATSLPPSSLPSPTSLSNTPAADQSNYSGSSSSAYAPGSYSGTNSLSNERTSAPNRELSSPSYQLSYQPVGNASLNNSGLDSAGNTPAAQPPVATFAVPNNSAAANSSSSMGNAMRSNASPTNVATSAAAVTTSQTARLASAAPGTRQLDGSQNPSMQIQKRAPNEVQVGIPSTFTLLVRNVGNASAFDVQVVDAIPKGCKLVRTTPQAEMNGTNGLVWNLGEMTAGQEKILTLELIPETEGEIGSVASVNFAAQASVRTISTQPKLIVKQTMEPMVLGGENLRILIEVANDGTGTARDVRLEEDVPANLRHASGSATLGLSIGDLAPGQSKKLDIELTAVSAGKVANVIRAVAENAASHESSVPLEVVSPKLQVALAGPKLRYLERQATYQIAIANTGTAIARDIDLVVYLPRGLQYNSAANEGTYIAGEHAVQWNLAELTAGSSATTELTVLPVEEGDFVIRTQCEADGVRAEASEKQVRVEGQSELAFSVEDDNDPIETDGSTTYAIKITNIGTRVDQDVQLVVELPEGATAEQINAPVNYQVSQRVIVFAPIPQMQSKDQQIIRLSVRHSREGTHVLRAQVKSKLRPVATIKEESTQVYRDN